MRVSAASLGLGSWTEEPLHDVSLEVREFWRALDHNRFSLCTCRRCGAQYWPYTLCDRHNDIVDFADMEWAASSGRGTVFSVVTVERVIDDRYAAETPFHLALIELDEGPLFPSRVLVEHDAQPPSIGTPVEVCFVNATGYTLPMFVPMKQP